MNAPLGQYLLRRLGSLCLVLLAIALVVFAAIRLVPGDPAVLFAGLDATAQDVALIRHSMGLDRPFPVQFVVFIGRALHGDLGQSLRSHRPVSTDLAIRFPASFTLASTSLVAAVAVGVPLGVLSAAQRGRWLDLASILLAIAGVCTPTFWLGLLLIALFSVQLGWLPSSGWENVRSLVLPAATLAAYSLASIARTARGSMLDVLRQDYVRTARAKGVRDVGLLFRHALRNAAIPILSVIGLQYGYLLGSSVVTETVFAWPGIGLLLVDAIKNRDYPVVQGIVLLIGTLFALINLSVDVLYAWMDPRVRYR